MIEDFNDIYENMGILIKKYHCNNCGVTFSTTNKKPIDHCIFCMSVNLKSSDDVENRNVFVKPFQKSKKDAIKEYRRKVFFHPMVPLSLKTKRCIQNIQKVYLPAYLTSIHYRGTVLFTASDKVPIKGKKKKLQENKYSVLESANLEYNDILLNVSTILSDEVFQSICQYDYRFLKELQNNSFQDSFYVFNQLSVSEVAERGRQRISNYSIKFIRDRVHHGFKKYKKDDAEIQFVHSREVLVPVYLFNLRYKDKQVQFVMNGENGKSYISLPIGIFESILFSVLLFGALIFILSVIAYYI